MSTEPEASEGAASCPRAGVVAQAAGSSGVGEEVDDARGRAHTADDDPVCAAANTAENAAAEALAFAGNATDAVEAFAATETAEPAAAVTSDAARSDETVSLFDAAAACVAVSADFDEDM